MKYKLPSRYSYDYEQRDIDCIRRSCMSDERLQDVQILGITQQKTDLRNVVL
jgi:hypothetical protein